MGRWCLSWHTRTTLSWTTSPHTMFQKWRLWEKSRCSDCLYTLAFIGELISWLSNCCTAASNWFAFSSYQTNFHSYQHLHSFGPTTLVVWPWKKFTAGWSGGGWQAIAESAPLICSYEWLIGDWVRDHAHRLGQRPKKQAATSVHAYQVHQCPSWTEQVTLTCRHKVLPERDSHNTA